MVSRALTSISWDQVHNRSLVSAYGEMLGICVKLKLVLCVHAEYNGPDLGLMGLIHDQSEVSEVGGFSLF